MSIPLFPTLANTPTSELPAAKAMPADRMLMLFKGPTMKDVKEAAAASFIENPEAWSCRSCICGVWTVGYEVRM